MDSPPGLFGRVLNVGAKVDLGAVAADDGTDALLKRRQVGWTVAEPDAEALHARESLDRDPQVTGIAVEECWREKHAAVAAVEGILHDRRRHRVDGRRVAHDADDTEGVRRSGGRRQVT